MTWHTPDEELNRKLSSHCKQMRGLDGSYDRQCLMEARWQVLLSYGWTMYAGVWQAKQSPVSLH